MKVGVPREIDPLERRVALVPDAVEKLVKAGVEVLVESGAGAGAMAADRAYEAAGARLADAATVFGQADLLLKVDAPTADEIGRMKQGAAFISFFQAWSSEGLVAQINKRRIASFSMEQMPRITRAQSMDALSSQATIAGYKAVLMAADHMPRIMPMLVTAAGTLRPVAALVVGAGVAGLMAIGTARRLGAQVSAFDVRPAAAEQVESMGARFIGKELLSKEAETSGGYAKEQAKDAEERTRRLLHEHGKKSQLIVTTAAIPRKKAPVLILEDTVKEMTPGSVIIDLAAESGGNCALTRAGQTVEAHGVTIMGPRKIAATIPADASQMYSRNVLTFVQHLLKTGLKDGVLGFDFADEITNGTCVTHDGQTRSGS
jgi:NAD(P) transhydrogenase subunit alpha